MKRVVSLLLSIFMAISIICFYGCGSKETSDAAKKSTTAEKAGQGTSDKEASASTTAEEESGYKFDPNKSARIKFYNFDYYQKPPPWAEDQEADLLAAFKQKYPNIIIDFVNITENMYDHDVKIVADTAAGNPPDVFISCNLFTKNFADQGIIECLDDYIKRDPGAVKHLAEGAFDLVRYKDKIWQIPITILSYLMYYNKSLFDKYGVPYPTDDWTLDQYLDAARRMTKHEGSDFSVGMDVEVCIPHWIIGACGSKPMEKDGDKWKILVETDPGTIKAIETMVNMYTKEKMYLTDEEWKATGTEKGDFIGCKRIGISLEGPYAYNETNGFFGVLPPKGPNGERTSFVQSFTWAIHTNAKDKDACWELVKFLTSDEYLKNASPWIPGDSKFLPAHMPLSKNFMERTDFSPTLLEAIKKHVEIAKYCPPVDVNPINDVAWGYRYSAAGPIWQGDKDFATAMKDWATGLNQTYNPQEVKE